MNIFIEPRFNEQYANQPIILVDVGASGGLEKNWQPAKKYLQVIGFEPDKREFINLEKKSNGKIRYLNTALHNEKASLDFYATDKQQTSSIFEPNQSFLDSFPEADRFHVVEKLKIETDTLDNQFQSNEINDADFIKVDTQGSELFILQGAAQTISDHIFGVEAEVEFVDMYQNQPLFSDVDGFLQKQGFQLFDLQGSYWKRAAGQNFGKGRGQLIYGNALYFRQAKQFQEIVSKISDESKRTSKILRAIAICALYGYLDYALEIIELLKKDLNADDTIVIEAWIKSHRNGSGLPNFKGKGKIAKMFYSIWEVFRPTHNGWATVDRDLGNR